MYHVTGLIYLGLLVVLTRLNFAVGRNFCGRWSGLEEFHKWFAPKSFVKIYNMACITCRNIGSKWTFVVRISVQIRLSYSDWKALLLFLPKLLVTSNYKSLIIWCSHGTERLIAVLYKGTVLLLAYSTLHPNVL